MRSERHPHALATPTRRQTVMFDPLAYIHPERLRLAAGFTAPLPAQRAVINRLLIARYRLDAPPQLPAPAQQSAAEKLLLKYWFYLPQIVFLLGCQRLRVALSRRGAWLRLPASVQAFMTLPLLPPGSQSQSQSQAAAETAAHAAPMHAARIPDRVMVLRQGMQQLRLSLGELPAALAQRLPLLLTQAFDDAPASESESKSESKSDYRAAGGAPDPAHALTLRMAIQHVKRYPISTE